MNINDAVLKMRNLVKRMNGLPEDIDENQLSLLAIQTRRFDIIDRNQNLQYAQIRSAEDAKIFKNLKYT